MPYTTAIFDMDGLLINTEPLYLQTINKIISEEEHLLSEAEWAACAGNRQAIQETLERITGKPVDVETLLTLMHKQLIVSDTEIIPITGCIELLDFLKEKDVFLCVASNTKQMFATEYLKRAGLFEYFAFNIGGDQVENRKPAPDIYEMAVAKAEAPKESCVVFEDTGAGLQAAKAADLACVAVPNEATQTHDFSTADLVATSLDAPEVLALF